MAQRLIHVLAGLLLCVPAAAQQSQPRQPIDAETLRRVQPELGTKVVIQKTLCFEIETNWIDPLPSTAPPSHGGDRWRLNESRKARGAKVIIKPDFSQFGSIYFLDERGCLTFEPPSDTFDVTIYSTGKVNGIDIVSYTDWGPDDPKTIYTYTMRGLLLDLVGQRRARLQRQSARQRLR